MWEDLKEWTMACVGLIFVIPLGILCLFGGLYLLKCFLLFTKEMLNR